MLFTVWKLLERDFHASGPNDESIMVDLTSVGQDSILKWRFKSSSWPPPLMLNLENLKMYFHFLSFVNTEMAEAV